MEAVMNQIMNKHNSATVVKKGGFFQHVWDEMN